MDSSVVGGDERGIVGDERGDMAMSDATCGTPATASSRSLAPRAKDACHRSPAEYDKHVPHPARVRLASGDDTKARHDTLLTPPLRNKAAMSISCMCVKAGLPRKEKALLLTPELHAEWPTNFGVLGLKKSHTFCRPGRAPDNRVRIVAWTYGAHRCPPFLTGKLTAPTVY
eukprot:365665-Chlamydomonas_euryale.AAC.7